MVHNKVFLLHFALFFGVTKKIMTDDQKTNPGILPEEITLAPVVAPSSPQCDNPILPPKEDRWVSSCCGANKVCSKSFVKYSVQCLFSLLVLLFAMYMYAVSVDPASREVWIGTISTIIGLHLPSPTYEDD